MSKAFSGASRWRRSAFFQGAIKAAQRARGGVGGTPYLLHGLGDDATAPEMTEAQWRDLMLVSQQRVSDELTGFAKDAKLKSWMQIAATLAIPLSAAIWKAIFGAAKRD